MNKKLIDKTIEKVLKENNLKVLYNMSTSGDFVVKQCVDKEGKNFILKVMEKRSKKLKQQFINEFFFNIFLSKISSKKFPYKIISYNIEKDPEYLLYKMINGKAFNGYYFLIGKRNSKYFVSGKIINLILSFQNRIKGFSEMDERIILDKNDYKSNLNYILKHKDIYEKYFGKSALQRIKIFLEENKRTLSNDLVLSHGDLNPKNIVIRDDKSLTFIDWTDIKLDNQLSDVARLYLASWNLPKKRKSFKKEFFKRINQNKKLFYLNIIILSGNFLKILDDSFVGIIKDFEEGTINLKIKEKLLSEIDKAKEELIISFREAFDYLENSLLSKKDFEDIINNFVNKKFLIDFFNKNKNKLKIKNKINDISLEIHRKRCIDRSKRLIATYIFKDGGNLKRYTAKIRIYKGKNLASKSWFMSRTIWDRIEGDYKYIARPIHYFNSYGIFFYETVEGMSFDRLLVKEGISEKEKEEKILEVTKYLAELHKINISKIEKRRFLTGNSAFMHINFLEEFVKWGVEDYELRLKDVIKKIKEKKQDFSDIQKSLIHGDFQIENFIFNNKKLKLIDFDDSEINDPIVDVGNFLVQIYYGGIMGEKTDYYREVFLDKYLKYNTSLDKKFLNERLNFYIILAKIKNMSQKIIKSSDLLNDDFASIMWDLFRVERRLENLKGDPLEFFKI